jgi:hypothetical protein
MILLRWKSSGRGIGPPAQLAEVYMKKQVKKLALAKETLQKLGGNDLEHVVGGYTIIQTLNASNCDGSCQSC